MNDNARRMMQDRMDRRDNRDNRDYRDYRENDGRRDGRSEYEGNFRGSYDRVDRRRDRDYEDSGDRRDRADYRRGRDRRDREDNGYRRNRYGEFTDRRGRDYADEGGGESLPRRELEEWGEMLVNADGTKGEHFTAKKMEDVARSIGVKYDAYTPEEFAFVANMLYSDFCKAMKGLVPTDPEREAMAYGKLAQAWLEDEDAPEGSEKLALYYYCIIDSDEE